MKIPIIFTDLDGTLLDEHYSFQPAHVALDLIQKNKIPLIIVSSKTRAEIEHYRRLFDNHDPFVSENGGGVFIPDHYFETKLKYANYYQTSEAHYNVIKLGARYAYLRKTIKNMQKKGFPIKGFGDMSAEEVAQATGLTLDQAEMAKQRDFDEPFFYTGRKTEIESLFHSIRAKGFNVTKGRIYHLLGKSNKGKAISILIDLFNQKYGAISSVGIGDSPNDKEMLDTVDIPVIVQKPDGTYDDSIAVPKLIKAKGIGPSGWNNAMISLISKLLNSSAE